MATSSNAPPVRGDGRPGSAGGSGPGGGSRPGNGRGSGLGRGRGSLGGATGFTGGSGARGGRAAAATLIALALLLSNAAWIRGLAGLPEGARLSGLHTLNAGDTPTYYAWIDQARRGHLVFRQLYTPEPHEPALVNPLFAAVGAAAAAFGISNEVAYHAARVLLGAAAAAAAYALFALCLPGPRRRLAALAVLLFAGGLGWVAAVAGARPSAGPIDLWVPEASFFLSLVESPLNLAAYALWALLAAGAVRALDSGGRGPLAATAFAAALLVAVHPYAAAPAGALAVAGCAAAAALGRAPLRRAVATGASILIGVGIGAAPSVFTVMSSPVFGSWREASVAPPPSPAALLAGIAWPLALALPGAGPALRRPGAAGPWMLAWIGVVIALVYAPAGPWAAFSRKLLEGLPLPLAVLAGEGLVRLLCRVPGPPRAPRGLRAAAAAGLIAVAFFSSGTVLLRDARAFRAQAFPYVLPSCFTEGMSALREQSETGDVVLAPRGYGLLVPAFAGRTVVCCHRDQTLDAPAKERDVLVFYGGRAAPRDAILDRYGVDWVLYAPGGSPPRALRDRLERVARTPCLSAYRVLPR